jgi:hypothetical protein
MQKGKYIRTEEIKQKMSISHTGLKYKTKKDKIESIENKSDAQVSETGVI